MIPRKKLDIGWDDLAFAASSSLRGDTAPGGLSELQRAVESQMGPPGETLACLSVRSAFDLLLETLALPPGSEILASAITIRDMGRIIREHGLIPVPVDLDMSRLCIRMDALERACSSRSRAILVAHLFGSRMPLAAVSKFARSHDLLMIEDCAQAFVGRSFTGSPESDVVMFSFGPIKTHTCLGGALVRVRDRALLERMRVAEARRPRQPSGEFSRRARQYLGIKCVLTDPGYAVFHAGLWAVGKSHDQFIGSAVRGFPGSDFFKRIRRRPSGGLLATMARRLSRFDPGPIEARAQRAEEVLARIPGVTAPGRLADHHSHWVVPVQAPDPDLRVRDLWALGLDATRGATSIVALPSPEERPEISAPEAHRAMDEMLFLPVYPEARPRHMDRLVGSVCGWPPVETRETALA